MPGTTALTSPRQDRRGARWGADEGYLRVRDLVDGGAAQLPDRLEYAVHAVQVSLGQVAAVRVDGQRAAPPGAGLGHVPPGLAVGDEPVGLKGPQRHIGSGFVELGDVYVAPAHPGLGEEPLGGGRREQLEPLAGDVKAHTLAAA